MKNLLLSSMLLIMTTGLLVGQETGVLTGSVTDSIGNPVDLANIAILGTQAGTMSSIDGSFELEVPAGRSYTVVISCVGYRAKQFAIRVQDSETQNRTISLQRDIRSIKEVSVSARQERASTVHRIEIEELNYMPTTTCPHKNTDQNE